MRINEILLSIHTAADPRCRSPRKRLAAIREMTKGVPFNKIRLAQLLLQEAQREGASAAQRPMWTRAVKQAAAALAKSWAMKRKAKKRVSILKGADDS